MGLDVIQQDSKPNAANASNRKVAEALRRVHSWRLCAFAVKNCG